MLSRLLRPIPLAALAALTFLLPAAAGAAPPADCDRCMALVKSDGTLKRSRNVTANYRSGVGHYGIVFKYPVDKCAIAVQSEAGSVGYWVVPSRRSVAGSPANKGIDIVTWVDTSAGYATVDIPFSIYVLC